MSSTVSFFVGFHIDNSDDKVRDILGIFRLSNMSDLFSINYSMFLLITLLSSINTFIYFF